MKSFAVAAFALLLGAGTAHGQYYTYGGDTYSYQAYPTYTYPVSYPAYSYSTYTYPSSSYVTSSRVVTSGYTPVESTVVTSGYTPIETTGPVLAASGVTYYSPPVETVYYSYPAYSTAQPGRRLLGRWFR